MLLAPLLLLLGCRSGPPPGDAAGARVRELEARVAWLEAQVRLATVEEELLDLQVQRAAALVTYQPDHPAVLGLDRRIEALGRVRNLDARMRRDTMRLRLEAERSVLLDTYTADHPTVQRIDAKIAFLRAE
jgi:hypothetical protein